MSLSDAARMKEIILSKICVLGSLLHSSVFSSNLMLLSHPSIPAHLWCCVIFSSTKCLFILFCMLSLSQHTRCTWPLWHQISLKNYWYILALSNPNLNLKIIFQIFKKISTTTQMPYENQGNTKDLYRSTNSYLLWRITKWAIRSEICNIRFI